MIFYPTSVSGLIVEILLDLADFSLPEQTIGNLMVAISRAGYYV